MLAFIWWLIVGLVTGALARLLIPGRQPMGLLMTMILGLVGSVVGGLISSMVFGHSPADPGFHTAGFVMSTIGALIVLSAGRLAGIVSERDYARNVILKGKQSRETKVREIMTTPVLYVTPEQTIDECMRLMTSRRVRHLPVLEGETVVGMLSMGDMVNWIITAQEQTIRHLQSYIAGSYPA